MILRINTIEWHSPDELPGEGRSFPVELLLLWPKTAPVVLGETAPPSRAVLARFTRGDNLVERVIGGGWQAWNENSITAWAYLPRCTIGEPPPEEAFAELLVEMRGTSGIEIKAVPGKSFDCVEFSLKADYPQTILHEPWIQFQGEEQRQWRAKWATEIARRATMFESMVTKIKDLELTLQSYRDSSERDAKKQRAYFDLWQAERVKYGLPEDFSDIPREEWARIDDIGRR